MITTLAHFAIVTYAVDPCRVRPHVDPRFELETIDTEAGELCLLSVVPFIDRDFRFVKCPWPRFTFGQVNYRVYVKDRETGVRGVWFLGTVLDSPSVVVPRYAWKLPWHKGAVRFDCEPAGNRGYGRYRMTTTSSWAGAELELTVGDRATAELPGFPDLETALTVLTHPLVGWYWRRDGKLGSYGVWHAVLEMMQGHCIKARFDLLDRLDLVPFENQAAPHSVLAQRETEFVIHLPPTRL